MTCTLCRRATPQPGFIHRDGWNCGPLVPLCAPCQSLPSSLIWDRIAQPSADPGAWKPVHLLIPRPGVYEVSPLNVAQRPVKDDVRALGVSA